MPYKLIYFDEVSLDIRDAKDWYKSQQEGLEKRFAKAIKAAIKRLSKMPTANAIRYKNVRIAHPNIFPYAIHYYVDDAQTSIVIVAIVHMAKHPNVSQDRT